MVITFTVMGKIGDGAALIGMIKNPSSRQIKWNLKVTLGLGFISPFYLHVLMQYRLYIPEVMGLDAISKGQKVQEREKNPYQTSTVSGSIEKEANKGN